MRIMTVDGPIAPDELGQTLGHEHLLIDMRVLWEEPPPERAWLVDAEPSVENRGELLRNPYDSKPNLLIDDPSLAVEELGAFRYVGGGAVIDLTTVGLSPDPKALRAISRRAGIHVVAGCGYYRQQALSADLLERSVEAIADDLRRWLGEGMYGTTVRAGLLGELGTSSPILPFEERQLRAAALVQRETSAAINVHPSIWAHEHLRILDLLEAAGADLTRVVLSHCDELVEPAFHARIAERGCVLSFDTFGSEAHFERDHLREPTDGERVDCLLRLLERGHEKQLLLSHDVCTRMQLHRHGGDGFDHLHRSVLPRLLSAGVGRGEIDEMLIATPRRLLSLPD